MPPGDFNSSLGTVGTAASMIPGLGTVGQIASIGSSIASMFGGGNEGPSFTTLHKEMVNDIMQKYPREVESLKMANLNPALAYGGFGKPVSNPVEPTPSFSPDYTNNRVNAAREASIALAQIDKLKADTAASESVAALNRAQAVRTNVQTQIDTNTAKIGESDVALRQYLDSIGRRYVEGEKMSADQNEAYLRQTYAKSDYQARIKLDQLANDAGYYNYPEMIGSEQGRQLIQSTALQQYSMPKASAEHDFYLTPFGKTVAPYLQSAESAVRTLGGVRNISR